MSWIGNKLGELLYEAAKNAQARPKFTDEPATLKSNSSDPFDRDANQLQLTVIKCANGTVVKASIYRPVMGPGPDWQHEVHIVKDDEKLNDTIGRILVLKALE